MLTAVSLFAAVLLITPFLGRYMFHVFEGRRVILSPVLRPVERAVYKVARVDETTEQGWKAYAVSVLAFSFVSIVVLYLLQRVQGACRSTRPALARSRSSWPSIPQSAS